MLILNKKLSMRILWTATLSWMLPLLFVLIIMLVFPNLTWPNPALHSLIEGAGVILNLSLGSYLGLLVKSELLPRRFLWPAAGFIVMAIIGGFHGAAEPGNNFVGLHSVGVFIGGLIFGLIALPEKFHRKVCVRWIYWASLMLAIAVSYGMLSMDEAFPRMLEQGRFSQTAIALNWIGALGFFIASFFLLWTAKRERLYTVLALVTLLFTLSSILFQYSNLWDATWWIWHFLRFIALLLLLSYMFLWFYRQTEHTKSQAEKLEHLAFRDSLTQLPNRAMFYQQLDLELKKAERNQQTLALLFIDLDRFKQVNDSLGHHIGDQLLVEVAMRLQHCLRKADLVARMGGDEFTVILNGNQTVEAITEVAEHILAAVTPPYRMGHHLVEIGVSIGVAFYPQDAKDIHQLMRLADTAMYDAKNAGRDTYRFIHSEQEKETHDTAKL